MFWTLSKATGVSDLKVRTSMSTLKSSTYHTPPTGSQILMAVLISPVGVAMRHGLGTEFGVTLGLHSACLTAFYVLTFLAAFFQCPYIIFMNPFGIAAWVYGLYVVIKRVDPPTAHVIA